MGYLGATLTQVFTCARGQSGRITHRCHKMGNGGKRVQMTSRTGSLWRIWGDFEKVSELRWDLPWEKMVGFRLLAAIFVAGATRVGGRWKARIERLCLSPCVEEPLNSKVIKKVSYLKEVVSVFRVSRFLCSIFMDIRYTFQTWPYLAMVQHYIITSKLFILDWIICNRITVYEVLILDRNTWNRITVNKLFVFEKNTWYHLTLYEVLVLRKVPVV